MYTWNELYHHGIKGQKWYIRRFQNEDGTLTEAGKARYKNYDKEIDDLYKNKKLSEDERYELSRQIEEKRTQKHKQSLGETRYNDLVSKMENTEYKIRDNEYSDYSGKYKNDIEKTQKEIDEISRKFKEKYDEIVADTRDMHERWSKGSLVDKLVLKTKFGKRAVGRDAYNEYENWIRFSKEGKELYSSLEQKSEELQKARANAANDWRNMTIEKAMESVPHNLQGEVFDLLKFNWYRYD